MRADVCQKRYLLMAADDWQETWLTELLIYKTVWPETYLEWESKKKTKKKTSDVFLSELYKELPLFVFTSYFVKMYSKCKKQRKPFSFRNSSWGKSRAAAFRCMFTHLWLCRRSHSAINKVPRETEQRHTFNSVLLESIHHPKSIIYKAKTHSFGYTISY